MRRLKTAIAAAINLIVVALLLLLFSWIHEQNQLAREQMRLLDEKNIPIAPYAEIGWEKSASEETCMTTALYFEAAFFEPVEGVEAIAHVILNRLRSREFPKTICGVVTEGYESPGCQFSFACNGMPESIPEYKRRMKIKTTDDQYDDRWARFSKIGWRAMHLREEDPTKGATHYWAASMDADPEWKGDIVSKSIRRIGSHYFGCSKKRGDDVPCVIN